MIIFLQTTLSMCTKRGSGSCLIIASAEINALQLSPITPEMKPHKIIPKVNEGKKISIGAPIIEPKIMPMDAIMTPMLIVTQKGPIVDLLYFCRTSI